MSADLGPSSILFIGLNGIAGIQSLCWGDIYGVNPADYEVVVVNCSSLVDFIDVEEMTNERFQRLQQDLANLANRFAKLVASAGTLVIMCPKITKSYRKPGFNCLS